MSDDRQDFLERQEARRRRMQQRQGQQPPSVRSPLLAEDDNKAAGRQPQNQARAVTRGKTGKTQPAGQASKMRAPQPPSARETGSAAQARPQGKAGRAGAAQPQAPADHAEELDDRARAGGLKGQRAAARRREHVPRRTSASSGPRPPLLTRLTLWGTAAICGLLILATLGEVWTVHLLNQQIAANEQTNQQLQAQNQQLSSSIQQLQQASTIEQEARKLGFIFPGDQPVVVVTTTPQAPPAPQPTSPAPGWWGFWPDWLRLFFGG